MSTSRREYLSPNSICHGPRITFRQEVDGLCCSELRTAIYSQFGSILVLNLTFWTAHHIVRPADQSPLDRSAIRHHLRHHGRLFIGKASKSLPVIWSNCKEDPQCSNQVVCWCLSQACDCWRTLLMELIGGDYPNLRLPGGWRSKHTLLLVIYY